jgi:hypothetical protein
MGLYLEAISATGSTVTNRYGVYQAGASDNNYFAGNVKVPSDHCEEAFFALYPDFFYEKSTSLMLWTQAWQTALDHVENKKPVIQLL